MVYHFFSKWKSLKSKVKEISDLIKKVEKVYRIKIKLFRKIELGLRMNKVDRISVNRLLKIYKDEGLSNLYKIMIDEVRSIDLEKVQLLKKEVDQFWDLLHTLSDNVKHQQDSALVVLDQLSARQIPQDFNLRLLELKEFLNMESQYLQIEDDKFKKIEEIFLIKKEPGAGTGGYVPLFAAIENDDIEQRENKLFLYDKQIEGVKIENNMIQIKGDHYTTEQNARWIEGDAFVKPSSVDPYSYLVQRGGFSSFNRKNIQKTLGIPSAEAFVGLEIKVFPEQVFIKIKKNQPIKFAIAHLMRNQVRVIASARAVAA